jgi:prevent-host-death family protein
MQHRTSLREMNQQLGRWMKTVERGEEVVITRRGKPIARLVPIVEERKLSVEQRAALERTLSRMRAGYSLGGRMPSKDELHERTAPQP